MSYSITVDSYFSAAHHLRGYRGKCESLHGHNWKVEVEIFGPGLNKIGMVFDFKQAKRLLEDILALLDHKELNRIPFFKRRNPTSELIAEFIFNRYQRKFTARARSYRLRSVTVWETPASSATFWGRSRKGHPVS